MNRIKRDIVASGVIGQFNHEWKIVHLYDPKYDSGCYDLFIQHPSIEREESFENIGSYCSIVEALSDLVEQFSEDAPTTKAWWEYHYTLWQRDTIDSDWHRVESAELLDYLKTKMASLPAWEHQGYRYMIRDNQNRHPDVFGHGKTVAE